MKDDELAKSSSYRVRWLNKNFDMQEVVVTRARKRTYGTLSTRDAATTQEIGVFATPSRIKL